MKDDDLEKRIRELERELADMNRPPQSISPYTGDASPYTSDPPSPAVDAPYTANPYAANPPYTAPNQSFTSDPPPSYPANPPYAGNAPFVGDPKWGAYFYRRPRRIWLWQILWIIIAIGGLATYLVVSRNAGLARNRAILGSAPTASTPAASYGPTGVPLGGELRVGGNMEGRTVDCNGGKLTLVGTNTDYYVTGKCASLTVGGFSNTVRVDSIDAVESSGYNNTVTLQACNNGALTLSSYGIKFNVAGHCASLAISSYNNEVTVDSVDSINISGYNNVVTYHTGKPTVTDSGYSNNIQQG
jgi:hypothetical protein